MADNPFDPKFTGAAGLGPTGHSANSLFTGAASSAPTGHSAYSLFSGAATSDLFPKPSSLGSSARSNLFGSLAPAIKRKAFFSFHWDDIMRVNVVRNVWKIHHPDNALMRSFYDSSLWESRQPEGDEAIKRLIREGVEYTSAVCVLVGSETWLRRWVRYEIARAIVDGRGLLAIHLNSILHHHTRTPHTRGPNPLEYMAIGKVQEGILSTPKYYLFERHATPDGRGNFRWEWHQYQDYTSSITLPAWLSDPAPGYVTPLSYGAPIYDYIGDDGHKNIGSWIDIAAQRAGR
jgi:MTH538 TIR-like domain (DUF1863)